MSESGIAATISSGSEDSGNVTQSVLQHQSSDATVYGISAYDSNSMKSNNPHSGIYEADSARTLDLNGANPACNQSGMAVVQPSEVQTYCIGNGQENEAVRPEAEVSKTLNCLSDTMKILSVQPTTESMVFTQNEREEVRDLNDVAGSISAESGTHQQNFVMQSTEPICVGNGQLAQARLSDKVGTLNCMHDQQAVIQFMPEQPKEPVLLESNQNHATVQTDGVSTTLPASMGEGGGYVPMVVQESTTGLTNRGFESGEVAETLRAESHGAIPMVCIEGNGSRESHRGNGYAETETMFTLNTVEQHAVAYGIDQPTEVKSVFTSDSFMNIDEGNTAFNLRARDYKDPQCVVAFEPGAATRVGGHVYEDDKSGTLRAKAGDNQQAVCVGFDAYNQQETGDVSKSLNSAATDSDHVPCVVDNTDSFSMCIGNGQVDNAVTPEYELSKTLNCMADPMKVLCVDQESADKPVACYETTKSSTFKKSSHAKTSDDGQGWESTEVNDTLNAFDNGETRTPTLVVSDGKESVNRTSISLDNHPGDSRLNINEDGKVQTLSGRMGTGGNNTPMVMDMLNLNPQETEKSMTLNAYNGTGGNNMPMVFENHSQDTRYNELGDVCQTVSATWGMGGNNQPLEVRPQTAVVRRLTCLECERLQGFPDNWTNLGTWVDTQGKKHKDADSPRYKALGNSIALPYWYWMAGNMVDQLKKSGVEHPTMASLFDGIAGFPYVYIRHGCTPLWTSEIEEFPIAVCKRHFGDEDTGEVGDIEEYLKLPLNWVTSSSQAAPSDHSPIAFDRAAFNQGANAKYDFSIEEDKAQTIVSRGPGGVCQSE